MAAVVFGFLAGITSSLTRAVAGTQVGASVVDYDGSHKFASRSDHNNLMRRSDEAGSQKGLNCVSKSTQCYHARGGTTLAYLDGMPVSCEAGWVMRSYIMVNCPNWQATGHSKINYQCCDVNSLVVGVKTAATGERTAIKAQIQKLSQDMASSKTADTGERTAIKTQIQALKNDLTGSKKTAADERTALKTQIQAVNDNVESLTQLTQSLNQSIEDLTQKVDELSEIRSGSSQVFGSSPFAPLCLTTTAPLMFMLA
eukprot:TRINITY_DN53876_c0_g1_i1.p1 TRINITY_DN53876_c0_g1~~TRINITY_DN53876_c0_g1_i1.p1  ORF type:complete len:256 (-),score=23.81 TRINITY_DN53876_c0_g1_i1:52-819(-)